MLGYAVAAGIGYYAGQPEGRRQLTTLRRRAAELARGPEARRLRERGWDLASDGVLATRNFAAKARSKGSAAGGAANGEAAATTGSRRHRVLRGWSSWRRARQDPAAATDPAAGTDSPELNGQAGFGGTTVAEDSKAAVLGLSTPPLAARAQPAAPPEDRP
jgi:hypothetical protein